MFCCSLGKVSFLFWFLSRFSLYHWISAVCLVCICMWSLCIYMLLGVCRSFWVCNLYVSVHLWYLETLNIFNFFSFYQTPLVNLITYWINYLKLFHKSQRLCLFFSIFSPFLSDSKIPIGKSLNRLYFLLPISICC